MSYYTQLTREERYQIYALKTAGHDQVEIARVLGRHKSTISRELARNRGLRGYKPKQAKNIVLNRRQTKLVPRILPESWVRVELLLHEALEFRADQQLAASRRKHSWQSGMNLSIYPSE